MKPNQGLQFNPEVTKDLYQICYEGTGKDKQFVKISKFTLADFNENKTSMSWYYNPVKNKKVYVVTHMLAQVEKLLVKT